MSDENNKKAWLEWQEWCKRPESNRLGAAFMAGRASRDAEVAELRRNGEAQLARLRANWENECGNLEMAEREVESLRQQLADAAEYLAGVKEADDSELQYRDEVEIPALRQQLAGSEHMRLWGEQKLAEAQAEQQSMEEGFRSFLGSYNRALNGLAETLAEVKAQALETFKAVVRGEGEPRHGGEWGVSVNHVEDLLDERAAEYRNGADHG